MIAQTCDRINQLVGSGLEVTIDSWDDWQDFVHKFDEVNPNPEMNHYTIWPENVPVPSGFTKLDLFVEQDLLLDINTNPKFITFKFQDMRPKGITQWRIYFDYIRLPHIEDGLKQIIAIPVITVNGGGGGGPPEPMHEVKVYDFSQWNDFVFPYTSNPSMQTYHHTLWDVNVNAPLGFKKKGIEFDTGFLLEVVRTPGDWREFHLALRTRGLENWQEYFEHQGLITTQLKPIPAVAVEYTGELPLAPPEISQFDLVINAKDINTGAPIIERGWAFDPREETASFAFNVNKRCTGFFRIFRGAPRSVFSTKIREIGFSFTGGGSMHIPWTGRNLPLRTYWYEIVVSNRGGESKIDGRIRLILKKFAWLGELPGPAPEPEPDPGVYAAGIFGKLGELLKKYWYVPLGMTVVTVGLLSFRKTRQLVLGRRR